MIEQLNVSDLEFENIRNNIKAWMQTRPGFTDYEYEGSGLSFLLDVLAYNTHYNSVLANFMSNEMFLDTALKRSSIISHAKTVGYKPRGVISSRAKIDITINTLQGIDVPEFIIRAGTVFNTSVNDEYYQFVTTKDVSALKITSGPDVGKFKFKDIEIVEGIPSKYSWKIYTDDHKTKYLLPNKNVDVSTISMIMYPSEFATDGITWNHSSSSYSIYNNQKVFFTQETYDNKTEIYFGNGTIGDKPVIGSIMAVDYMISSGSAANGAKIFFPAQSLKHNNATNTVAQSFNITTVDESFQGFDGESIQDIKYNASNHFMTQSRAVTALDYESIIRENFFNIKHIRVWGGEESAQKQYGVVLVSIVPNNGDFITEAEKELIKNVINEKSLMGIKLKFADYEYINIEVMSDVLVDPTKIAATDDVVHYISENILNYSELNLQNFGSYFRYSKMNSLIDTSHKSIESNTLTVKLYKTISPIIGSNESYSFNFLNPIKNINYAVLSTTFTEPRSNFKLQLTNINDKLVMGYFSSSNVFVIVDEVGVIDVAKGTIQITSLNITSYDDNEFRMYVIPEKNDIFSNENNILRIRTDDIKIKLRKNNA